MSVSVTINPEHLARLQLFFKDMPKAYNKAAYRGINKGVKKSKVTAKDGVRSKVNLTAKKTNEALSTTKASPNKLRAALSLEQKTVNVQYYGAAPTKKKGTSFTTWKNLGKQRIQSAFRVVSIGKQIYIKDYDNSSYTGRGPFETVKGPSVQSVVERYNSIWTDAADKGGEAMQEEFARQLNLALDK